MSEIFKPTTFALRAVARNKDLKSMLGRCRKTWDVEIEMSEIYYDTDIKHSCISVNIIAIVDGQYCYLTTLRFRVHTRFRDRRSLDWFSVEYNRICEVVDYIHYLFKIHNAGCIDVTKRHYSFYMQAFYDKI